MKRATRRHLSVALCIVLSLAFLSRSHARQGLETQTLADKHGNKLVAFVNPITKSPHRIMGPGVKIDRYFAGAGSLEKSNVEAISRRFVADYEDLLQVDTSVLELKEAGQGSGNWYVTFQQTHQGVPVYRAYVSFTVDPNWNVILMGSDFHPQIEVSTKPVVSGDRATEIAREAFGSFDTTVDEQPLLLIFPNESDDSIQYHLTWRLRLSSENPSKSMIYFIDAIDATVVEEWSDTRSWNRRIYGTVTGNVRPEYSYQTPVVRDFRHEEVEIWNNASQKVASGNTNANGYYDLTWTGAYQYYYLWSHLTGPYVEVIDDNGGECQHESGPVTPSPTLEHNWTWDDDYEENTVFYHINMARDYLNSYRTINYDVEAHVDATLGAYVIGQCGSDGKIEFSKDYDGAETSDIIYHEYGHYFQYNAYGGWIDPSYSDYSQGSAMMEAFADYVGVTINNDYAFGEFSDQSGARYYDNTKKYPDDYDTTSGDYAKYYNGLIIGGAVWDLREQLGQSTTDALWVEAMEITPHPDTFVEYVENMLLADDTDANLGNGTPHDSQILAAFEDHGIRPGILYVPGYYSTIQAGINAAVSGQTVMVCSGTYNESITMKTGVDVVGVEDAWPTIQHYLTAVTFNQVTDCELKGFEIRGANYGVRCAYVTYPSYVLITGNRILDGNGNGNDTGAGIDLCHADAVIKGNLIYEHYSGVLLWDSDPMMRGHGYNTIRGNHYGVRCNSYSEPYLGADVYSAYGENNLEYNEAFDVRASSYCDNIGAEYNYWYNGIHPVPTVEHCNPQKQIYTLPRFYERIDEAPSPKLVGVGSPPPTEASRISEEGKALVEMGRYAEALSRLRSVVEDYPEDPEAVFVLDDLLRCYRKMGEAEEGLDELRRIGELYGNTALGGTAEWFTLQDLVHQGKGSEALAMCLRLKDKFADGALGSMALYDAAMLCKYVLDDIAGAQALFQELEESYPRDAQLGESVRLELETVPASELAEAKDEGALLAYPNPLNPHTTLSFALSQAARVKLGIYNTLGQRVAVLLDAVEEPGKHSIAWDGRDVEGTPLGTGVYFARFETGHCAQTRRILLLK